MRAKEFLRLIERAKSDLDREENQINDLESFKEIIQSKIKDLPITPESKKILDEVDEILSSIQLGGRKKSLKGELATYSDNDVKEAKDLLAKYIVSLDAELPYKRSMLDKWKKGGLINVSLLLDGKHSINEIVMDYDTNPAIFEFANDLLQVAPLGHGKGEFMLKVLSPQINSPGVKGDLLVRGLGVIEVKTSDAGLPRFYDREVRPRANYRNLSEKFISDFGNYLTTQDKKEEETPVEQPDQTVEPVTDEPFQSINQPNKNQPTMEAKKKRNVKVSSIVSKSGLNIGQLLVIYTKLTTTELKQQFNNDLLNIFNQIFVKAPQYPGAVLNAIVNGNIGEAKQLYSAGILNNYLAHKEDKGILFIDLRADPAQFTFFKDNESLNNAGMRVEASTFYPVSTNEQYPYPQMEIVDTTQSQPTLTR